MTEEGFLLVRSDAFELSSSLFKFWEDKTLCDTILKFGEDESSDIFTHACVLAASSPVLKSVLMQKQQEPGVLNLDTMGIQRQVWEYIIKYMYLSEVLIPNDHANLMKDLADAAEQLQFSSLLDVATEYITLTNFMNDENVIIKLEPDQIETEESISADNSTCNDHEYSKSKRSCNRVKARKVYRSCNLCDFEADSKEIYMAHKQVHKEESDIYECSECNLTFNTNRSLKLHEKWHMDSGSFPCRYCDVICTNMIDHTAHVRAHPVNEACPVEICDFISTKRGQLSTHVAKQHQNIKKPWHCNQCDYAADKKTLLQLHETIHTDVKKHHCSVCTQKFKRVKDLKRHTLVHSEKFLYNCQICTKGFNRKYYLSDHIRRYHGGEQLNCPHTDCLLKFPTYDSLYRHKAIAHEGKVFTHKKEYVCAKCGHMFSYRSHLKVHERAHNNDRPFKCKTCSKLFLQNSDLKKHMMIHTGEKPFLCTHCPYTSNRLFNLRLHEKIHSGGKGRSCAVCDITYQTYKELQVHSKEIHGRNVPRPSKRIKREVDDADNKDEHVTMESSLNLETIIANDTETVYSTGPCMNKVGYAVKMIDGHANSDGVFLADASTGKAVERKVPKSAIITKITSSKNKEMLAHPFSHKPLKHTQIVTSTIPTSVRMQTNSPMVTILKKVLSGNQIPNELQQTTSLSTQILDNIQLSQASQPLISSQLGKEIVYTLTTSPELSLEIPTAMAIDRTGQHILLSDNMEVTEVMTLTTDNTAIKTPTSDVLTSAQ